MTNTPRNVVLQVGALITLYFSVSFLLTLIFSVINLAYPAATDSYWEIESASDSVRLAIAMLIVFFPAYLALTYFVNQYRRAEKGVYQSVIKWLIYFSLLVGGLILLGTLVTTIYTFLNGDLTTRFFLKAAAVVLVVGLTLYYYVMDAKGYWMVHPMRSRYIGGGAFVIVIAALVFGFNYIETPAVVREMKLDEEQVNDLRNIQWQIDSFLAMSSSTLPADLEEAYADSGLEAPQAPEGRENYSYEVTDKGFRLCGTFAKDKIASDESMIWNDPAARIKNAENWNYKAGRHCFERAVK